MLSLETGANTTHNRLYPALTIQESTVYFFHDPVYRARRFHGQLAQGD